MFNLYGLISIYYKIIRPLVKKAFYLLYEVALRILSILIFWIKPKPLDLKQIHKILLIKMERIGDLVLSTPAIRAIREKFPNGHISIIVNSYTKAIIKNDPHLDEVLVYDFKKSHKDLIQKIRFVKNLRIRKFDLAIDLSTRDFLFTPVWLSYLSGAKSTLGLDNFGRGFLFNIKLKPEQKPRPLAKEILHILSPLGIDTSDMQPKLFISDEDKDYLQGFLVKEGIKEQDLLICIHPGGVFDTKYWKRDGYAKVAQYLIKQYKAKVIFIGSRQENNLADEIISLMGEKPINLVGKITLGQLMALILQCRLFIGNNSGPLNIAVGLNIPTISFLGPSIPERWRPQGEKNIVFRIELPCSPCELGYCWRRDFACMRGIGPEAVIDAVNRQLQSVGR